MNKLVPFTLFVLLASLSWAQKRPSLCREGCAPYVNFFLVQGDSLLPITFMDLHRPNRIKVALDGGIEKVKHKMIITSKNAKVTRIENSEHEYWVVPQAEVCEMIVDIKTYEEYQEVRKIKKDGKEEKEIIKKFPPKTYMVGYERFASR